MLQNEIKPLGKQCLNVQQNNGQRETDEYKGKETIRNAKLYIRSISMACSKKEPKYLQRRLPLRETLTCKPIDMSKRNLNSLLRVFKCFVFHMVSICTFAKELIYAFEILWPPNHTNHTTSVTSACALFLFCF